MSLNIQGIRYKSSMSPLYTVVIYQLTIFFFDLSYAGFG